MRVRSRAFTASAAGPAVPSYVSTDGARCRVCLSAGERARLRQRIGRAGPAAHRLCGLLGSASTASRRTSPGVCPVEIVSELLLSCGNPVGPCRSVMCFLKSRSMFSRQASGMKARARRKKQARNPSAILEPYVKPAGPAANPTASARAVFAAVISRGSAYASALSPDIAVVAMYRISSWRPHLPPRWASSFYAHLSTRSDLWGHGRRR